MSETLHAKVVHYTALIGHIGVCCRAPPPSLGTSRSSSNAGGVTRESVHMN